MLAINNFGKYLSKGIQANNLNNKKDLQYESFDKLRNW